MPFLRIKFKVFCLRWKYSVDYGKIIKESCDLRGREMKNFYVMYDFKSKEMRDGFIREIREERIKEITVSEDGCIRYDYFYPVESERKVFLWEQWDSAEAQQKHTTQPHFAIIGKIKEKYGAEVRFIADK